MTAILLALRGGIAVVPPIVWKALACVLILAAVYLAGDVRGRRIEIAKCEARAAAAQKAADAQDLQAEKDAHAQDLQTTTDLKNQKWVDDATIDNLNKQLAARPAGSKCAYDDTTLDPDERTASPPLSGRVRLNPFRKGAGDKKHPGAAVVPQPNPRP